jgi:Peptidase family M23
MPGFGQLWLALFWSVTAMAQVPSISSGPGTVVKWTIEGATRCGMKKRVWQPVQNVCYYPIDLETPVGARIPISVRAPGKVHYGRIVVEALDYGSEDITLPDIPQAHPTASDLARDARDRTKLAKIFTRPDGPAQFTLPLGPPARPLPPGKAFGVKRTYNGKPAAQPHMGIDYPTPVGSPVIVVAPGTVMIAEEMFFEGNAVFVDHGDGLVSMYFHLMDIKVDVGQKLEKRAILGHVGSTGRATGPHLFFGVRWHDARIDPKFLLQDPVEIPEVK